MKKSGHSSQGFTIVELLIVVVVIAILAAITIAAYNGIQNRAKAAAVQSAVSQAVKKVQSYAALNSDSYPANASDAGLVNSDGLVFEVASNNSVSPKSYCITLTTQGSTYFQTSTMTSPVQGTCMGMLAWWPFDGNAQDASGNGVHATVMGATATAGADGSANGAYQLGETNQYITVGTPSSFASLPNAFTYSIWLARTGTATGSQWPQIMGASDTHVGFGIRTNNWGVNTYFEWGLTPYAGATFTGSGTNGSLSTLNEWHLMTTTFDGSVVLVYWDGQLKYTSSATVMRPTMSAFQFTNPSVGWPGKIDDARVYNRALSAAEVQTMFKAGAQ